MFFYIRKNYFTFSLLLAMLVYGLQKLSIPLPEFMQYYLNDLLCMPIVLYLIQTSIQYIKSDPQLLISKSQQITVTFLYAIYFELFLPMYHDRYTSDYLDAGCYFLGCFVFYVLNNSAFKRKVSY